MIWLKNPKDKKPDTMLTFSTLAVIIVLIKILLSDVQLFGVNFGSIDAAMIASILTPTLSAYVARKYTDKLVNKGKEDV